MLEATILRLEFLIDAVPHQFLQLERESLRKKPAPDKWSPIEIMGHLCDSALYNWQRFSSIPWAEAPYQINTYDQDALVQSNGYQKAHVGNLIHLWVGLNRQISSLWKSYSEDQLATPIILPNTSRSDLSFLIKDYVDHLEHHLKQIFSASYEITIPKSKSDKGNLENPDILKILLRQGNVSVEYYQPKGKDLQQPHLQDEFYFIANGEAEFDRDGTIEKVMKGEFLFVPAGQPHHFLNFSEDFSTWVVFF